MEPLLSLSGCLAQTLHHASASGLERGFAVSPLWHDLWTPSLARGCSPSGLGGEGGVAAVLADLCFLLNLRDNLRQALRVTEEKSHTRSHF